MGVIRSRQSITFVPTSESIIYNWIIKIFLLFAEPIGPTRRLLMLEMMEDLTGWPENLATT